jgi:hypothetical protein
LRAVLARPAQGLRLRQTERAVRIRALWAGATALCSTFAIDAGVAAKAALIAIFAKQTTGAVGAEGR